MNTKENEQLSRPTGVTFIAISYFIFGIIAIGWGLQYFTLRQTLATGFFRYRDFSVPVWEVLGFLFVGLGLCLFVSVYGMLRRKGWVEGLAIAISLLGMLSPVTYIAYLVSIESYSVYAIMLALFLSVYNGAAFIYFYWGKKATAFFEMPPKVKPPLKEGHRPLGVTIVAILTVLGGVGGLVGGSLYVMWAMVARVSGQVAQDLFPFFGLWGALLIVAGFASFVGAFGLLKRKRWGFWITIILSLVGVIAGGIVVGYTGIDFFPILWGWANEGDIVVVLAGFFFILYLSGLGVKRFFGVGLKRPARMSKGERKGVLSEMEEMLSAGLSDDEIKEQWRHLLVDAEIEELLQSLKATLSKPKEETAPAEQEFVKRQDVVDKEVFDANGKRVGFVKDIALTPSGKMGLVVSKPDKSDETIPADDVSVMGDVILLRKPATEKKAQDVKPSSSHSVKKPSTNQ